MQFFLQREIELRNFNKIRDLLATHPQQVPVILNSMIHIHQVVSMEDLIPDGVKDEILMGIEDLFSDYEQQVFNQQEYFAEMGEQMRGEFMSFFNKIYQDYLTLRNSFKERYEAGTMPIDRYAQCLVAIGEAERNLKPYMYNLGITDIHFN